MEPNAKRASSDVNAISSRRWIECVLADRTWSPKLAFDSLGPERLEFNS